MTRRRQPESPHEKMLRRRIDANRAERDRYKKLKEWLDERVKEIKRAPQTARISFFCETCDADWDGRGDKMIRMPKGSVWFAYYSGHCPAGHACVRRITDRLNDPYFFKSYVVRKQQAKHTDELLPHWHPRFKIVYPERYRELVLRMKPL